MEVVRGKGRRIRKLVGKPNRFSLERQTAFLKSFASSCNIRAAAAEVGISSASVWIRRRDDEQFRAAFEAAREHAIVNLESELVARGLALLDAATPEDRERAAFPGMDAKLLHTLIQCAKRELGKEPGTSRVRQSDPNEAAARLSALLLRMRMERKRELDKKRREQGR